jgi:acyl-[acyl-carrier-protein] desaturase
MSAAEQFIGEIGGELPQSMDPASIDHEIDTAAVHGLVPLVEELYQRHEATSKPWYPHLFVPYSLGRTYPEKPEDNVFIPEESPLPIEVRTAFEVGLLTEDNLPGYFNSIEVRMGNISPAHHGWNRKWTAEEGRHAIGMRDFLIVIDAVDAIQLEDDRVRQVSTMDVPDPPSVADAIVYVALQEKATQISHRNSGRLLEATAAYDQAHFPFDKATNLPQEQVDGATVLAAEEAEKRAVIIRQYGRALMNQVAKDESRHFGFYNPQVPAMLELAPSHAMKAVLRQVLTFAMPGKGIRDFNARARIIADAEIYDPPIHHDQILQRIVMQGWKIADVEGLDEEGKRAQEVIVHFVDFAGRKAAEFVEKRAARREANPDAVWVGKEAA